MISLTQSFMSAKDHAKDHVYLYSSFVLKVQCFYFRIIKGPLVLLSKRDKMIAIMLHESQNLNIGNQYQKDAT